MRPRSAAVVFISGAGCTGSVPCAVGPAGNRLPAFRPGTRQALLRTSLRKGGPLRLLSAALPVVPLRLPGLRGCRRHLPSGRSLPDCRSR